MTGKESVKVSRMMISREAVPELPIGNPQERLIVKNRENLHLLGRFFQAMILNFLKKPGKARTIEKMNLRVAFDPFGHPENALTLSFKSGRVTLECGIKPHADITIMGEPSVLMMLSRMPAGLAVIKFFKTYEGQDLINRFKSGELKIKGIFKHPIGMLRFSRIMAPNIN